MNFLNPGLFALLAPLLALPLAVHLFNRRYPRSIRFPDLERIRKSIAERSRLARWRHVLMTLLRTLAVLLALLAFLKPVLPRFGSDLAKSGSPGRRVLLLVDRSLSLEHLAGAATAASRNALVEAGKILATLGGDDRSNAILAGAAAEKLLPDWTSGHDQVRVALGAQKPGYERADTAKALALAVATLGENASGAEVYVLSDFQRTNWADAAFDELPAASRLFFVDTSGGQTRENTALMAAELSPPAISAGERVKLEITAGNWTDAPATLPVEAILDGGASLTGEIALPPWSTGRTTLEFTAPGEGLHRLEARIPDDALSADNRRFLKLDVKKREDVLILTDSPEQESGALFATTALDPFEDRSGAFSPKVLPVSAVTAGHLASTSKLILTGAGQIGPELATRLTGFLEAGGGLIYFLDGATDQANLEILNRAAGRTVTPFLVSGRLTTEHFGGKPQKIAKGNFESRFLRLFRGENRQALALLEFYTLQRAFPTGEGEVLLNFADGTPALGVADVGLGTAIFCNFTPAELSSNLARQRLFPAWMQELAKNLTPESLPANNRETGTALAADLWQRDHETHGLRGPDGQPVSARTLADGERVLASFDARAPGFYTVGPPQAPLWLEAVNVNAEESDLRPIETTELARRREENAAGTAHAVTGAQDYEELTNGRPIQHWFLLGFALILAVEMLLHRPLQRATGNA